MMHCDLLVGDDVPAWVTPLRVVPLYFFLSGLFFKPDASFRDFVLCKIDTLVVPSLSFKRCWLAFCRQKSSSGRRGVTILRMS